MSWLLFGVFFLDLLALGLSLYAGWNYRRALALRRRMPCPHCGLAP